MAQITNLLIAGLSVKLRRGDVRYQWNGQSVLDRNGEPILLSVKEMMADDWQLDEPSRADVLAARGYSMRNAPGGGDGYRTIQPTGKDTWAILTVTKSEAPRTAAQMTRVLNFLDTFRPKPLPKAD